MNNLVGKKKQQKDVREKKVKSFSIVILKAESN